MQDSSKKCFCKAEFDIEVGCDDTEGNSELSFSTIEGVCASQLGYYLIFQEG